MTKAKRMEAGIARRIRAGNTITSAEAALAATPAADPHGAALRVALALAGITAALESAGIDGDSGQPENLRAVGAMLVQALHGLPAVDPALIGYGRPGGA